MCMWKICLTVALVVEEMHEVGEILSISGRILWKFVCKQHFHCIDAIVTNIHGVFGELFHEILPQLVGVLFEEFQ